MSRSVELLKKLQIAAGSRIWFINVPRDTAEALTAGAEVQPVRPGEPYDGVLAFAATTTELAALAAEVLPNVPSDGLLWFCYRKGAAGKAAGLTRDVGWEALTEAGYRPVRSVSIDDNWTGLRFRRHEDVKAKEGSRFAR